MNFKTIKHPVTQQTYNLLSENGKKILKQYVKTFLNNITTKGGENHIKVIEINVEDFKKEKLGEIEYEKNGFLPKLVYHATKISLDKFGEELDWETVKNSYSKQGAGFYTSLHLDTMISFSIGTNKDTEGWVYEFEVVNQKECFGTKYVDFVKKHNNLLKKSAGESNYKKALTVVADDLKKNLISENYDLTEWKDEVEKLFEHPQKTRVVDLCGKNGFLSNDDMLSFHCDGDIQLCCNEDNREKLQEKNFPIDECDEFYLQHTDEDFCDDDESMHEYMAESSPRNNIEGLTENVHVRMGYKYFVFRYPSICKCNLKLKRAFKLVR